MPPINRRDFVQQSLGLAAGAAVASSVAESAFAAVQPIEKVAASERVRVGVMGAGGRALSLIRSFSANPNVEVVYLSDIDTRKFPKALEEVAARQMLVPKTIKDFREILDDDSIDALVVGTPDHWHAIPTILACQAGKDVYVEKPDSHDIVEGQRMVAAMKKHGRIVQMGSQHRSTRRIQTALEFLRTEALGRCLVAKAWESTKQKSIGRPADGVAPPEVDYDFWLGCTPLRPFNPVRFHGNWRWFHEFGTGDLGNDGVHRLDMAFAALNAAAEGAGEPTLGLPAKITASGGKWYFDDAQEFPDTLQVNYEYAGADAKLLTYEMRIWAPYDFHGESEGAAIYGDKGYMLIGNERWRALGPNNELLREEPGDSSEVPHVQNFVDCIKSREKPACDLETIGHPASILCHAGNISARVGRQLHLDPATETFKNDEEANALRGRTEYRAPWLLPNV